MNMDTKYACPFCAYYGRAVDFRLPKKSGGYSVKMFKCIMCNNMMYEKTLKKEMSIKEWAEWMYVSIRVFEDFYERLNFPLLIKHLKELGISYEFWSEWKEIKEKFTGLQSEEISKILNAGAFESDKSSLLTKWMYDRCPNCGKEITNSNYVLLFTDFNKKTLIDGCLSCYEVDKKKWMQSMTLKTH